MATRCVGSGLALGCSFGAALQRTVWLGVSLVALAGCGRTEKHDPEGSGGSDASGGEGSELTGGRVGQSGAVGAGGKTGGTSGSGGSANGGATGGAIARGGSVSTGGTTSSSGAGTGGTPVIDPAHPTAQLDILLMIDNSLAMADKQTLLAEALPVLFTRLTRPNCLNAAGDVVGSANQQGVCGSGTPEFSPVTDIHVGIVTSSLGAHGGQICVDPAANDKGQLLLKVRTDPTYPVTTWNNSGFLAWDPDGSHNAPPGESDPSTFSKGLVNMVLSAGQSGCGYEASLESWYRFLVDPEPPESIPQVNDPGGTTTPVIPPPAENPILLQRAAFLRPDSALAIVMLSDENDCSILDQGQGWLIGVQNLGGGAFRMPRATAACEANPNDPCCTSCASSLTASGCPAPASTPECAGGGNLTAQQDNLNLRCWDQKRRFGFDMLYPVQRYVDGLTQTWIVGRSGAVVQNPLFPSGGRTPSMVFLSGILGVPWQDLASKESLAPDAALTYLSHAELTAQKRWPLVLGSLGDPKNPPTPPDDKLMFETNLDRTTLFGNAQHPLVDNAALAPSSSAPLTNAINGHESNLPDATELQYACIFPLPAAKDCAAGAAACDCKTADSVYNHAVCDGDVQTLQTFARAYPGVRELRVLKAFGDLTGNAIPASICPKFLDDPLSASYGYYPAVSALVKSMTPVLKR